MRQLAADEQTYRDRTGRRPTVKICHRLMARASQATRPAKKTAHPLPGLRARWRTSAVARFGQALIDNLLEAARKAARVIRQAARTPVDIAAAALEVTAIAAVHHGGRFRHRHLLAEARRHLARTLQGHPAPPLLATAITTAESPRPVARPRRPATPTRPLRAMYVVEVVAGTTRHAVVTVVRLR
ncbi:hypothetical protein ACH4D4_28835 [Streptomyces pristinaespiralis]|uniref:hypothetical protein n=1 Tax=Streptomyces pristinaespiralis TaxID=38300 RepID=UPI003796EC15